MGYSNVVHPILAIKTVTFDAGSGTGAQGNVPIFTVTSQVLVVAIVPFCTTLLAGATATLELGVTGILELFVATTTGTDIDADEFWVDTGPDANGVLIPAIMKDTVITDNIVGTVEVADITSGVIRYSVYWLPLSATSNVVAA